MMHHTLCRAFWSYYRSTQVLLLGIM